MEWATKGASALAERDQAIAAVTYYTKALLEHPTSPDYFTQRAVAFSRLKPARHDLALRDAEYAIILAQKRAKREKIQAAQQRRVVALYGLERYYEAKQLLQYMLKWRGKDNKKDKMEHDMWMAKVNGKLRDAESNGEVLKEYPDVSIPQDHILKRWLQIQLKADGTFRFDEEEVLDAAPTSPETFDTKETLSGSGSTTVEEGPPKASVPIRNDFYQNNDNLIVTFYAKKVDPTKFVFDVSSNSLSISFPDPDQPASTYTYTATPTFAALNTEKSSYKIYGTKIELTLAKIEKGLKWPSLQATNAPIASKLPSPYVSKSKGIQDWDKRAAEIVKKQPKLEKQDAKPTSSTTQVQDANSDADSDEGGDAVDGFFKKLYKGADDDTRRAMMKSFQESNGTALSTNWADVSRGKVEEVKSKDDK